MDRRSFISRAMCASIAGTRLDVTSEPSSGVVLGSNAEASHAPSHDLLRHRFGINYTPSRNWWFCWNDWNPDPIRRDLDAVAALGADHLRILLIWPYFQPNPEWVSPVHLGRLEEMLILMGERNLDAVVTVFTGQLSGWHFLPPFNRSGSSFYTDPSMWAAQELMIRQLGHTLQSHPNVLGLDFGNEMNTCWSTDTSTGDAWMVKMFSLMDNVLPRGVNVNGVDQSPWFEPTTFSARALAARPMPAMHCYPYWSHALQYGGPMDPPSTHLLAAMAALIRSYANDARKPVWAEEFNTCIESLTEEQQAQWLETAVPAATNAGVSWFTYWDSHDVDRKFKFNSLEYSLGLLTNDGRVKKQGRVFKELADTYRGRPVQFSAKPVPPPPAVPTQDTSWAWMSDWLSWH